MATLTKRRARKSLAASQVNCGYGNYASPGLLSNKHISLDIGEYMLRIEMSRAVEIAVQILNYNEEYKNV